MLRVTEVEREADHEVFDVDLYPHEPVLLWILGGTVLFVLAIAASGADLAGVAVLAALTITPWPVILLLLHRATTTARVTVHADRVVIDHQRSRLARLFNQVGYRPETAVEPRDRIAVTSRMRTPRRAGGTVGGRTRVEESTVATKPSDRPIVHSIGRRRDATELAARLNKALQRLRTSGPPG